MSSLGSPLLSQPEVRSPEVLPKPQVREQVEWSSMSEEEPGHLFKKVMSAKFGISEKEVQKILRIVERPSLPKEVVEQVKEKVAASPWQGQEEVLTEAIYDPLGPFTEIQSFNEMTKIRKFLQEDRKEFMQKFCVVLFLSIGAVLLARNFTSLEFSMIFGSIFFAISFQVLGNLQFVDLAGYGQFLLQNFKILHRKHSAVNHQQHK